jgi:hypothetical protein
VTTSPSYSSNTSWNPSSGAIAEISAVRSPSSLVSSSLRSQACSPGPRAVTRHDHSTAPSSVVTVKV